MKTTSGFLSKALLLAFTPLATLDALAQITVLAPGFGIQTFYTHTTSDDIVSYDWDTSANLYYMTYAGFPDVSVWKYGGGAPLSIYANANNFAGASVVTIGDYVYFNDSNLSNTQFIHRYGPTSGSATTTQISTTTNSGLFGFNGELFITGAPGFGTNRIYHSDLAGDGSLVSDPATDLGVTSGSPGPLSFDLAGNLYYAPGFGDLSIYKWSAAEVAAAITNSAANPLTVTGHLWLNYGSLYGTMSGATSMAFDAEGDLLLALTNFVDPSLLVEFGADLSGAHDGTNLTVLTDTARLGELRTRGGDVFVSSGNQIVQIVPEPSVALLATFGFATLSLRRNRRQNSR